MVLTIKHTQSIEQRAAVPHQFLSLVLTALILVFPFNANAQEAQPGNACSTVHHIRWSGGPEKSGIGYYMTCQGGVWVRIIESDTAGNIGVKQAAPKAPLHIGGEAIIGATTGLPCDPDRAGGLRWSSANSAIELCDGTGWQKITPGVCDDASAAPIFTNQIKLTGSTPVTSNIAAITGMDAGCSATVSVSGTGGGPEYRICSTSNCSSVDIDWTNSNNTLAMQGKFVQLRATSSAGSIVTFSTTLSIGPVSSVWDITTDIIGCSPVGTICSDGSVYAGLSPDGLVPMYITRCDLGQSWDGANCVGTRHTLPWNSGDSGWTDTAIVNCLSAANCGVSVSGETNTSILVAADGSTQAGFQDHVAARECNNLNAHGQTDWYLPSLFELDLIYDNLVDAIPVDNAPDPLITGFITTGTYYWSSSEGGNGLAWRQNLSDGTQSGSGIKSGSYPVRCARK